MMNDHLFLPPSVPFRICLRCAARVGRRYFENNAVCSLEFRKEVSSGSPLSLRIQLLASVFLSVFRCLNTSWDFLFGLF